MNDKKAAAGRAFSVAFLSPSPVTLKHDWYRDLLWQKVGVANLAGMLRRAGFSRVTQYDFNNQVKAAYAAAPEKVRLMLYSSPEAVRASLRGARTPEAGAVAAQTRFLLDEIGVKRHDLFAISISQFLGDNREIDLGVRLAQCLARELKLRFPGCVVALGGMQNMSVQFQRAGYVAILKECPFIDYAVCGEGHRATLELCRTVRAGGALPPVPGLTAEKVGGGTLLQAGAAADSADSHARYFAPERPGDAVDLSVPYGYPSYDKANSKAYSYTGARIRKFYNLPAALAAADRKYSPDNYLTLQVSFSEGCGFNCLFCSNARTGPFLLSLDESVRMLKMLRDEQGCRHFLFYNPNFNPSFGYAREFLGRIIKEKLDILWADCFNLRIMDDEMIAMMREAGVIKIVTGVEYPTPRMLKYINKGITVEQVNRRLEALHKAGIWNHALLITGMPTETGRDIVELEAWLKDTKDLVNAYTVGSYHMADGSPFQKNPEKYGFKLKDAMQLYCQTEFDEEGGLRWREKARQNAGNNRRVRAYIDALKGSPKPTASRMDDSHLLMYLYRVLGHDRKAEIERLYEAAYTVNPHISAAYGRVAAQAGNPASGLSRLLRAKGADLRLGSPGSESFRFTLEKGRAALGCSVLARSEDILINPAPGRLHGDCFVLNSEPRGAAGQARLELEGLVASVQGRLSGRNAGNGGFEMTLEHSGGLARFSLFLGGTKPRFRFTQVSGKLSPALLGRLGALMLESAAAASGPPRAAEERQLRGVLPEILRLAEAPAAAAPAKRRRP